MKTKRTILFVVAIILTIALLTCVLTACDLFQSRDNDNNNNDGTVIDNTGDDQGDTPSVTPGDDNQGGDNQGGDNQGGGSYINPDDNQGGDQGNQNPTNVNDDALNKLVGLAVQAIQSSERKSDEINIGDNSYVVSIRVVDTVSASAFDSQLSSTESGYNGGIYVGEDCDINLEDVTQMHFGDMVYVAINVGDQVYICEVVVYEEATVAENHEHSYGDWVVVKEPTCLGQGARRRVCSVCGDVETEIINALGHDLDENTVCRRCGEEEIRVEGLTFELLENDTYAITAYSGSATELILPSSYLGKPVTVIGSSAFIRRTGLKSVAIPNSVTSIGSSAFSRCTGLRSLTIGNSVTSIGDYAFFNCTGLTTINYIGDIAGWCAISGLDNLMGLSGILLYINGEELTGDLVIPNGVTSIGDCAFYDCTGLTSVTIGISVTSIGDRAFSGCTNLKSIAVDGYNPNYSSQDGILYDKHKTQFIYIPKSIQGSITIPNGVTAIPSYAFNNCTGLTSITIPNSVTSIGGFAFENCVGLRSINYTGDLAGWFGINGLGNLMQYVSIKKSLSIDGNLVEGNLIIPDSVTTIPAYAFQYCTGLTSITIGNGVTSISEDAFSGCTNLRSITVDGNNPNYSSQDGILYNKQKTQLILIPKSIQGSITIPNGVTSIGGYAFYGCTGLTSISIPDSVTSIGGNAFDGCTYLQYNEYGNAYYLGNNTNPYVVLIKVKSADITICLVNDNCSVIYQSAFSGCSGLMSVTIGKNVTNIGSGVFKGCSSLESITIPFVGAEAGRTSSDAYQYPFGYIFGTTSYTGGTAVTQYYHDSSASFTNSAYYIPSTLRNVTVTGGNILYGAFYGCTGLTSITIPNDVTSIGDLAFKGCTGLTSITIPDSVTSIGREAFSGCSGLTSVTIGNSVTSIGEYAFKGCSGLTTINYTGDIAGWCGISGLYYLMNCGNSEKSLYIDGELVTGDLVIPNGVTTIPAYAFQYCTGLTSVTIGNSVTNIGSYAFRGCTGLTSITIGNSVTSIGNSAFSGCTGLTSVTIGDSVTSIGEYAFSGCTSLTSITIPNSVTSIGEYAFSGCSSLASITIPFVGGSATATSASSSTLFGYIFGKGRYTGGMATNQSYSTKSSSTATYYVPSSLRSVTVTGGNILYGAFYNCSMLTSVTIGNGVTIIGYYAFDGCTGLTSITIPNSVTIIGDRAFYGCTGLTSITIPDSVTSIGNYTFDGCTGLTSIIIPNSVTSIGDYAFAGCSSLTSITIGNGVTSIGEYAFKGCSGLTSVTIGNSVTSIGEYAFKGCSGLTTINYTGNIAGWCAISGLVTLMSSSRTLYINGEALTGDLVIPNGVTSIGSSAFSGCTGLTSIIIPNSVTSIGKYAFEDCTGLTSITIGNSVTSIGDYAFSGCDNLTTMNYTGDIAGWCSISGLEYLTQYGSSSRTLYINGEQPSGDLVILNGVKTIPAYAYYNCTGLTSVTIPDSVTSIGNRAFAGCSSLESITIPFVGGSKTATSASASTLFGYIFGTTSYTGGTAVTQYYYVGSRSINIISYIPSSLRSVTVTGGNILDGAFYNCSMLTSVTIGNSVTSIGWHAFEGCTGLTTINYTGDIAGWCGISGLFNLMSSSRTLYINGEELTGDLVIPSGVATISDYAFEGCTGLTSIIIPNSVTSIGKYAFKGCSGLTSITIGNSVTSIGESAFYGCTSLKTAGPIGGDYNIKFGWTEAIPSSAFAGCAGLTSITIPDSVASIGVAAFSGCTGLTSITIPNSVTSIGSSAFRGCTGLTSITIPNSVTSIGNYTFDGCTGLTSITIGNGVTSIGYYAFDGCTGLTDINFNGTQEQWNAISKGSNWNYNTGNYTIHCTDGDISKS